MKNFDRICVAVILIITFFCGWWAVGRVMKQKRLLQQENVLFSERLKDMNLADGNLKQIRQVMDATRNELKALNERIPEKADMGAFLQQLDGVLKKRDILLVNLTPLGAVEKKLYNTIPVRLIISGTFGNLYDLLYDLENMNRLVVVDQMIITRVAGTQANTVEMTANIFERGA